MRKISEWGKDLRKALRDSPDLQNYAAYRSNNATERVQKLELKRLSFLISEVELGLTLLAEVAPEEPAISVSALLSGYRFPVPALENDDNWSSIQRARFYLVRRRGSQWENSLSEYIRIPELLRIFRLRDVNDIPVVIPSSTYPCRWDLYRQTLSTIPEYQERKVELAESGYWYAKVSHKGHATVEVPINIPEAVANIATSPQVSFRSVRSSDNPPQTVTFDELLISAEEMDDRLAERGYEAENYRDRLQGINWQLYDSKTQDFRRDDRLTLNELIHIVGLLNVGKSTMLQVLIYHFGKRGYRCGLIVNDVVEAVRLASLFREGLGISAAPVLGRDRAGQLEKAYKPLLATMGEDIELGAVHPAWRWFSPVCPLLALVQSEEKWQFGDEPCHDLYQKSPVVGNENSPHSSGSRGFQSQDDLDPDEWKQSQNKTCPLYYKCPRHQLERDLTEALVWVLTPASFIHTGLPRQTATNKLTFAEAVYRECHFLFVDEADRVQVQLDGAFAPDEVLVDGSGNSLLNKLGLKFAEAVYNNDRRNMGAELLSASKRANDHAQIATDAILPMLHNKPELVDWLGSEPFTARSLWSHIVRDLLAPPEEENAQPQPKLTRQQRTQLRQQQIQAGLPEAEREERKRLMQEIEGFLQVPLKRGKAGELADIAYNLSSSESDRDGLEEIRDWLPQWLEPLGICLADEAKIEKTVRCVHLAILVTVLNNRMLFLLDRLMPLNRSKVIDLHDVSLNLLNRPPRDYLSVMPSSPVGNILGFKYTRDRQTKRGGKLEYFRYVGVGRYILLNFPTLFAVDNWQGPHTVLISGTSYAPGTPVYHLKREPTVLLEPATNKDKAGDAGIAESEFVFQPQENAAGNYIAISGLPPNARKKAGEEMVKAICYGPGQGKNFLDDLFDQLQNKEGEDPQRWGDRQRLLLVVNSYDEADRVESALKPIYRLSHAEGISVLRRDNAPGSLKGIRRGQIRDLKNLPAQIVVAPLMALERGHNILNERRIAAFGAAIFLSRPMPVPDDWQTTIQQLNAWAIDNFSNRSLYEAIEQPLTLRNVADKFYLYAVAQMQELNCRAPSFSQLTDEERAVLCWTQLVSLWQIVGRLVRGGVPCLVRFLDKKFAPNSAEREKDEVYTSLLVGIVRELERAIEGQDLLPYQRTLSRSLYGAFYHALKNTKDLNYDQ